MTKTPTRNILKNQRGQLTLDFIFALTIGFGFTFIFLAISFTLSMVEVSQYITYATSRAYMGAHQSQKQQQALAMNKFGQLTSSGMIASILKAGWIKLGQPTVGNFGATGMNGQPYPESSEENLGLVFVGAQVPFQAKVLNVQLPLIGSTATQTSTGKATLNSYLLREITSDECENTFDKVRAQQILNIAPYQQATQATNGAPPPAWVPTDNGC